MGLLRDTVTCSGEYRSFVESLKTGQVPLYYVMHMNTLLPRNVWCLKWLFWPMDFYFGFFVAKILFRVFSFRNILYFNIMRYKELFPWFFSFSFLQAIHYPGCHTHPLGC